MDAKVSSESGQWLSERVKTKCSICNKPLHYILIFLNHAYTLILRRSTAFADKKRSANILWQEKKITLLSHRLCSRKQGLIKIKLVVIPVLNLLSLTQATENERTPFLIRELRIQSVTLDRWTKIARLFIDVNSASSYEEFMKCHTQGWMISEEARRVESVWWTCSEDWRAVRGLKFSVRVDYIIKR